MLPYDRNLRFAEYLRPPGWVLGGLGALLGLDMAALTLVAWRSLGDDPLLTGGEAALFFVMFGAGMAILTYVMLDATVLAVSVESGGKDPPIMKVTMGMFGKQRTWQVDDIHGFALARHDVLRHGGRGNLFAPSSRRAWTMFACKDGLEFESTADDGRVWVYFVASARADELMRELRRVKRELELEAEEGTNTNGQDLQE